MKQWYYYLGGKQNGPVGEDQLQRFLSTGNLAPETLIWTEGLEGWQPAQDFPELTAAEMPASASSMPDIRHHLDDASRRGDQSFHHTAATAGLFAPLLAFIVNLAGVAAATQLEPELRATLGLITGLFALVLVLIGMAAAIIALCGIPKHGKRGLLGKGIGGLLIPIVLLLLAVPTAMRAQQLRAKALETEASLKAASEEINASVPAQVDEDTRLDGTEVLPGREMVYNYTLIRQAEKQFTREFLESTLRPSLVEVYGTHPDLAFFRENGITLHYRYHDPEGKLIHEIVIRPGDLKKQPPN